jgi:hypothetical protein
MGGVYPILARYCSRAAKSGSKPKPGRSGSSIAPCSICGRGKESRSGFGLTSISPRPSPPTAARSLSEIASPIPPPSQCGEWPMCASVARRPTGTQPVMPPHLPASGWTCERRHPRLPTSTLSVM